MWRVSVKVAYRTLLYTVATALVLFAVVLSMLRYLLPQLPDVTQQAERFFAQNYAVETQIGELGADWNVAGPQLILRDVQVLEVGGEATAVRLNEARVVFDFWQSLRTWSLKLEEVKLADLQVTYDLRDSSFSSNTGINSDLPHFFLNQLDEVTIENSTLELVNLVGARHAIHVERLSWNNQGATHQGIGSLRIDALASNSLDVMIDIEGNDPADLAGQIYVQAANLDIAAWLQQQLVDTEISQAEFNFTMWLNFANSDFRQGILQLARNELHWRVGERQHQLVIPKGLLKLRPEGSGWLVNNNPITLVQDNTTWTLPTMSWLQTPETFALSADDVPVAPLLQLATLSGSGGQQFADHLSSANVDGWLDVRLQQDLNQPLRWQLQGRELAWKATSGVPGVDQVALDVLGQGAQAQWLLAGEQVALRSPHLSAGGTWPVERLQLGGRFQWQQGEWDLAFHDGSRIDLEGLPLHLRGKLSYADELFVAARLEGANTAPVNADVLRRYLPEVMGTDLHDYLQTALIDAEAEALAMVWRGPLQAFPYLENEGVFRAQVTVHDLVYRFQPDWPMVTEATAHVHFGNERMHILSTDGVLEQMRLPRVDTVIENILQQPPVLQIDGTVIGDGARLQPIFAQSPLAKQLGTTFTELQLQGEVQGSLALTIPLNARAATDVVAKGYVDLQGNELWVDSIQQHFTQVRGRVHYHNDQISSDNLALQWQQLPLQVALQGELREDAYHVQVDVDADWSMAALHQQHPATETLFAGQLQWQGNLALSLPEQGSYSFHWQQQSDLAAFGLDLPEPMKVAIGSTLPWQLQVSGGPESLLINSTLGEHTLIELQYNGDGSELTQGYARIGERVGDLPNPDLLGLNPRFPVEVGLHSLDAQEWLDKLTRLQQWLTGVGSEATSTRSLAAPVPDVIELQAQSMHFGDYRLHDNAVVIWPQQEPSELHTLDTWRFRWRANEASLAGVYWPQSEQQAARLELNADYLELVADPSDAPEVDELAPESAPEPELQQAMDYTQWPQIVFDCRRCQYQQYPLGEVQFQFTPATDVLRLDNVHLRNGEHELKAQMRWLPALEGQPPVTAVTGSFVSGDVGDFLKSYQITSIVQDSPADFDFELAWQGAPEAFNLATLEGTMNWRLGQGYLSEVSDRGARLLSVLSLESILRKLRFDFRDIFANGLFFTEFAGQFVIEDGVVATEKAGMNGSAGDMEISGTADLVSEAIDYQLFFVPKVTSSLPVILAWMVNPPSGLAALLIDRMLQDAQVISRLEYKISGTMDAPVVEEVSRDSREVTLPVETLPQQQEGGEDEQDRPTDSGSNDQPTEPSGQPRNP
ncbi:TIGR02099 family protein [Pseudidiomarina sediminum]|uniref:TIGR02099 family protein n=1 Tax=Pseudidiomarina sediminum TaxID=431675 RepID=A0A432Z9Z3_9GAMM|nr:YhdP family protein [Pseudidiomarina sediminum]RUO74729.1 TIGR02099 family protein [Pseudidiomarina sediminum]